jgi:hypothetical protein
VFSRLSKLLNQENALGAPCLRGDSYPLHVPRGAWECCGRRNPSLSMPYYCWRHRIIIFSADAHGDWRPMPSGARRGKAKQGRRDKTSLTFEYLLSH